MLPSESLPSVPEPGVSKPVAARRGRVDAALQNGRLLGVVLLIVLSGLVARTLLFARETRSERALSEMYEQFLDALHTTKSAYSPALITSPPAPVLTTPDSKNNSLAREAAGTGRVISGVTGGRATLHKMFEDAPHVNGKSLSAPARNAGVQRALPPGFHPSLLSSHRPVPPRVSSAVEKWQALTRSRYTRAAEWRRLAIVRALFGQPGALDAVAHIDDPIPDVPGVPRRAARISPNLRAILLNNRKSADPFGHGAVGISSAQEHAFWNALYGPGPIKPAQVPALQQTLLGLRLGWFANVAQAQLYQKAGMKAQARQYADAANRTSRQVRVWSLAQGLSVLAGFAGVIVCGLRAAGRWTKNGSGGTMKAARQIAARSDFDFVLPDMSAPLISPIPVSSAFGPSVPPVKTRGSDAADRPFALFPAPALLLAFVVYILGHTFVGLAASLALKPFVAHLEDWHASRLMRLESALEIGLYVPIFLLPLLALRARVRFDPLSGVKLGLGVLLRRLGYHTRGIAAEVGAGAWAYLLTLPAYLLISALSQWMFQRFHTPVNPAQFETLTAQGGIDKALVFLMAAVLAPLVEETMFRGLLYSALRKRFGVGGAAALSAAVFAAVHPTLPGGFLPIWCLGVALALVYERRGSLLPGMVLHGIHNGLIVMMGLAIFG